MEGLNTTQLEQVRSISKNEVHQYFDYYLREIVPAQQRAARQHTYLMIEKHDDSDKAHGSVEHRVNKMIWVFMGVAAAGGGAGVGVTKLLGLLG